MSLSRSCREGDNVGAAEDLSPLLLPLPTAAPSGTLGSARCARLCHTLLPRLEAGGEQLLGQPEAQEWLVLVQGLRGQSGGVVLQEEASRGHSSRVPGVSLG